ncbi:MAG TPA: rRNA maturation RNase YbeY [Patescibacteria group bacterium]|nr:rRNA maturation RNase YbeY [Patescibacteria group bacterium]
MILNRQRSVGVSLASLERFWQQARQSLHLPEDSLAVCLVSEARIARWNRAYRGKRGPTDVLSFPAQDERRMRARRQAKQNGKPSGHSGQPARAKRSSPPAAIADSGGYLGDVAIAPAVARRNARRLGRPLEEELRILILHGVLHLLGYDHETDDGEMDRIERRLRRRLGLTRS